VETQQQSAAAGGGQAEGGQPKSVEDQLWDACGRGKVEEVKRLLDENPRLRDCSGEEGWTPLMLVSRAFGAGKFGGTEFLKTAEALLDRGAPIDAQNDDKETALFISSRHKSHAPMVKLLLKRGADATMVDKLGLTPLHKASVFGHLDIMKVLLRHPSVTETLNHRDIGGGTPLYRACGFGNGAAAWLLLKSGADPTIADDKGITPMQMARRLPTEREKVSSQGRQECVAALMVGGVAIVVLTPPSLDGLRCGMAGRMRRRRRGGTSAFPILAHRGL
jgi:ankyrin repeat protein